MRYVYTAFLFVLIHLISVHTALGKIQSFGKSSANTNALTGTSSEEFFSEYTPILPQGTKKDLIILDLPFKHDRYKQTEQPRVRMYSYFSYAHYLLFFNFLYPKHVFW